MNSFGASHYVPVLKTKTGEKKALANLDATLRPRLTPLMQLVESQRGADLNSHLRTCFKGLVDAVGTRGCFLDALELGSMGPLAPVNAFALAEWLGMPFIPVTGIARIAADVQAAISYGLSGRGVCLRLTRQDLESGGIAAGVANFLAISGLQPAQIDLIMDLGPIEEMVPAGVARMALLFLAEVPTHPAWRTFTLLGTAFPLSMGVVSRNSSALCDRVEWQSWRTRLHARRSLLQRLPTFGDYAIQHPRGVEGFDPQRMQASATIRYTTTSDAWLLIKGQGTRTVPPTQQFPLLATSLVSGPQAAQYLGSTHCSGCSEVAAAAAGQSGFGSPTVWRRIGTVHHLTIAVEQIAGLPWP